MLKKAKAGSEVEELARVQTERRLLDQFNELMKDPGRNEEQLNFIADTLGSLNPKRYLESRSVETMDGKQTITHNFLQERVQAMVPTRVASITDAKGQPAQITIEEAAARVKQDLPRIFQESNGDVPMTVARIKKMIDGQFRRGAYERFVQSEIAPHLNQLVRQVMTRSQQAAQQGAQQQVQRPAQALPTTRPDSQAPGWRAMRDAATESKRADTREYRGGDRPLWKALRDAIAE